MQLFLCEFFLLLYEWNIFELPTFYTLILMYYQYGSVPIYALLMFRNSLKLFKIDRNLLNYKKIVCQ
jgi:hypothetical protein